MVRPAVRFRPAARRALGGDLVPVFFVDRTAAGAVEIWSGTQLGGIVESVDIYNDVPRNLAPTASKGMLDLLIAAVSDFGDPAQGDETRIYSQSETVSEANEISVISQHVINGVAYLIVLRSHRVTHAVSVSYQYFAFTGFQGQEFGPVSPVLTVSRSQVLDAVYDVVVFAVDLETAQVTSNAQIVYSYAATPTFFGNFYALQYTATETRTPTPLAITGLLPAAHPFKACGASIWSLSAVDPAPTTTTANNLAARFAAFFTSQVSRSFNNLLGLNTDSQRRLISKAFTVDGVDQVFELSDYQNTSASTCALYEDIALAWSDSYSSYAAADVLDREDVFADLDGLTGADQDLFLSTTYQPPSFIAPGTSTEGTTSAASYFMETDTTSQLSFVDNQNVALRYWINA
jgi:hypothetical protein